MKNLSQLKAKASETDAPPMGPTGTFTVIRAKIAPFANDSIAIGVLLQLGDNGNWWRMANASELDLLSRLYSRATLQHIKTLIEEQEEAFTEGYFQPIDSASITFENPQYINAAPSPREAAERVFMTQANALRGLNKPCHQGGNEFIQTSIFENKNLADALLGILQERCRTKGKPEPVSLANDQAKLIVANAQSKRRDEARENIEKAMRQAEQEEAHGHHVIVIVVTPPNHDQQAAKELAIEVIDKHAKIETRLAAGFEDALMIAEQLVLGL